MRNQARRILRRGFTIGWLVSVVIAFRQGATAARRHRTSSSRSWHARTWRPGAPYFSSRAGIRTQGESIPRLHRVDPVVHPDVRGCRSTRGDRLPGRLLDADSTLATTGERPDPDLIFVKDGPRVTRVAFTGVEMARMRGNASRPVYDREVRYDRNGFRNLVDRVPRKWS